MNEASRADWITPNRPIRKKPTNAQPKAPPIVLTPYSSPILRPRLMLLLAKCFPRTGRVAPISAVGTMRITVESRAVSGLESPDCGPSQGASSAIQLSQHERTRVTAALARLRQNSRLAYRLSKPLVRSAKRPPNQPPNASPPKKEATTTLTEKVELPRTNCNCLNQTVSQIRDAIPEHINIIYM